jgi:hypothetical protein
MRLSCLLAAALGVLVACAPPQDRRPRAAPPPSPPPAKHYTMICKNSQTGAKAACGTRDAVMVGLKED